MLSEKDKYKFIQRKLYIFMQSYTNYFEKLYQMWISRKTYVNKEHRKYRK